MNLKLPLILTSILLFDSFTLSYSSNIRKKDRRLTVQDDSTSDIFSSAYLKVSNYYFDSDSPTPVNVVPKEAYYDKITPILIYASPTISPTNYDAIIATNNPTLEPTKSPKSIPTSLAIDPTSNIPSILTKTQKFSTTINPTKSVTFPLVSSTTSDITAQPTSVVSNLATATKPKDSSIKIDFTPYEEENEQLTIQPITSTVTTEESVDGQEANANITSIAAQHKFDTSTTNSQTEPKIRALVVGITATFAGLSFLTVLMAGFFLLKQHHDTKKLFKQSNHFDVPEGSFDAEMPAEIPSIMSDDISSIEGPDLIIKTSSADSTISEMTDDYLQFLPETCVMQSIDEHNRHCSENHDEEKYYFQEYKSPHSSETSPNISMSSAALLKKHVDDGCFNLIDSKTSISERFVQILSPKAIIKKFKNKETSFSNNNIREDVSTTTTKESNGEEPETTTTHDSIFQRSNKSLIDDIINLEPSSGTNNQEYQHDQNTRENTTSVIRTKKISDSELIIPKEEQSNNNPNKIVHSTLNVPFDEDPPTITTSSISGTNFKQKAKAMLKPFRSSTNKNNLLSQQHNINNKRNILGKENISNIRNNEVLVLFPSGTIDVKKKSTINNETIINDGIEVFSTDIVNDNNKNSLAVDNDGIICKSITSLQDLLPKGMQLEKLNNGRLTQIIEEFVEANVDSCMGICQQQQQQQLTNNSNTSMSIEEDKSDINEFSYEF